jgi:hypothetical protein
MRSAPPTTTLEGEKIGPVTTTTAAPRRVIGSWVPSKWVLRIIKPFVSTILRSPLHRLLSDRLMLLTFYGRKTGRRFTIPVGYTREGDTLTFFSAYSWYKNLRGGRPVVVYLRGRDRTGLAEVIENPEAVLEEAEHLVAKYCLKGAGRKIGLALDINPPPTTEELAAAMERYVVIRIVLD